RDDAAHRRADANRIALDRRRLGNRSHAKPRKRIAQRSVGIVEPRRRTKLIRQPASRHARPFTIILWLRQTSHGRPPRYVSNRVQVLFGITVRSRDAWRLHLAREQLSQTHHPAPVS